MLKISLIVIAILSLIWLILLPGFDSLIAFVSSLSALIGVVYSNKKKLNTNYVYEVQIRGYKEIDTVVHEISKEYFQIANYKAELIDGEWWNVVLDSKTRINHENLFYSIKEIVRGKGKVYHVTGEGKSFGLMDDGSSRAQYL